MSGAMDDTSSDASDYQSFSSEGSCELEDGSFLTERPKDAANEAFVTIKFHQQFPASEFHLPLGLANRHGFISHSATYEDLRKAILFECGSARSKAADKMAELYQAGYKVRMEAWIDFSDERAPYCNTNQWRKARFATVGDMFSPRASNRLPITVAVTLVPHESSTCPPGFPGLDDPERGIHSKYNVISQVPLAKVSEASHHQSLHCATITAFRTDDPTNYAIRKVPNRVVNGVLLGSCDVAFPLDPDLFHHKMPEDRSLAMYGAVNGRTKDASPLAKMNQSNRLAKYGLPQEPTMTFREYQPAATDFLQLPEGDIHLAVRMVYRCNHLRQNIRLPANVTMVVHPGKGVEAAITEALTAEMLCKVGDNDPWAREIFFVDSPLRNNWKFEFWVLPQRGPKPGQAGKLHRYKKGSLKWFLDPQMAAKGEKHRTLYMEAHMVPHRQLTMQLEHPVTVEREPATDSGETLGRFEDVVSDEEDDLIDLDEAGK